jgi:hypothetical protein
MLLLLPVLQLPLQQRPLHSCSHSKQLLAFAELSFPRQRSGMQLVVLQLPTQQQL